MSGDCGFPRQKRLTTPHEYRRVFAKNKRYADRYWTLLVSPNQESSARLGLAIAKKRAKRAVDRNRLKRILRESFRQQATDLPNVDIIAMPRSNQCAECDNDVLNSSLRRLWKKIISQYAKQSAA